MQLVKKFFIFFLILWFSILFFMPKTALYYKVEKELLKNDIQINEKNIEEGIFSLTLYDAKVYVKGIHLVTVEKIDLFTLLFYTKIDVDYLLLDESLKNVSPIQIEKIEVVHAIWNPLNVKLSGRGEFDRVSGNISILNRQLHLDFNGTKGIEMLKSKLQQNEKGWFYEAAF